MYVTQFASKTKIKVFEYLSNVEPEKFRFMCQNSNYSEVYSRMKRIQTRLRCFTLDIFKSVIFESVKAKSFKKSQNKFLLEWSNNHSSQRRSKKFGEKQKKTSKITLQVFYFSVRVKQLYHGTTSTTAVLLLCPHFNFCVH